MKAIMSHDFLDPELVDKIAKTDAAYNSLEWLLADFTPDEIVDIFNRFIASRHEYVGVFYDTRYIHDMVKIVMYDSKDVEVFDNKLVEKIAYKVSISEWWRANMAADEVLENIRYVVEAEVEKDTEANFYTYVEPAIEDILGNN